MKNILLIILSVCLFFSCKQSAEKIGINNIEEQRAYQYTILSKALKSPILYKDALKSLISEYRNIRATDSNSQNNLNYYLSILYNQVFYYPMYTNIYDTASGKFTDSVTYINYKDSSRILSKMVLEKNPNNTRAFLIYSSSLYWEWMNFMKSKYKAPFYGVKSNAEFSNSLIYIIDNSFKFRDIDTSRNKFISQEILEYSYFFVNAGILKLQYDKVDYSEKSNLNALVSLSNFTSILDKVDTFYIIDKNYYLKHKTDLANICMIAKTKLDIIIKKENEEAELARNTITINHDGSKDWDKESTLRNVGEEVWSACFNNPNAVRVVVNISDNCNDIYGKSNIYTSSFVLKKSDINIYRKYQSASAFNSNCYEWGLKLLEEYKPCGSSQFNQGF